jgi:ubiquinol-cytochrome c reductase cytochrome b subunit
MFFIAVYIHIGRGLYYGSFMQPRLLLWYSGVIIFFLMMAAGFLGYVLPWGQMSFWGATVITNMFSAIPWIGDSIVQLLWGGFSVDQPTLNRFFSLHFLIPFILVGVVGLHLILLHENGSNNPLGINLNVEKIPFFTYYIIKDIFGIVVFIAFFSYFVINIPNYLGHSDNYIEAQPLVTPTHIVPEWYFLIYYAVLRTIPDKLGGVIAMLLAIAILLALPFLDTSNIRSAFFKPIHLISFIYFINVSILLLWMGQSVVEYPYIQFSTILTIWYFMYFFGHVFYDKFYSKI